MGFLLKVMELFCNETIDTAQHCECTKNELHTLIR